MTQYDFPGQLEQISDHAWIFPMHPDNMRVVPNIGVIISGGTALLVDAGNSPAHGRAVLSALDAINAPPVQQIIYTHHHWDHICGAQVFDVPVMAHRTGYDLIREMQQYWNKNYLIERGRNYPYMMPIYEMLFDLIDWDSFRLVVPQNVFDTTRHTLNLNGLTINLEHVGGQHAADSVVVSVDDVLFLGDCYYGMTRDREPPVGPDYDLLEHLLNQGQAQFVAGHAPPFTRQEGLDWIQSQRARF